MKSKNIKRRLIKTETVRTQNKSSVITKRTEINSETNHKWIRSVIILIIILCVVIYLNMKHTTPPSHPDPVPISTSNKQKPKRKHPHVIVILTDDVGFDDINPHRSECNLPTIYNQIMHEKHSIILKNFYVQCVCTPSRAALLTGRYPIHNGMTYLVENPNDCYGLPLDEMLLSNVLSDSGVYSTHIVGKWHLGHCRKEMLPINRGFDSFYGSLLASHDYYLHIFPSAHDLKYGENMHDFHDSTNKGDIFSTFNKTFGLNSIELLNKRSVEIVKEFDAMGDKSLFLLLSHNVVHGPINTLKAVHDDKRIEAWYNMIKNNIGPYHDNVNYHKYSEQYDYMRNDKKAADELSYRFPQFHNARPVICGMLSCVDDGVKHILKALRDNDNMLQDSIIFFLNDNGGADYTRNFPLRSGKFSIYEGGTKTFGFIYAPGFIDHTRYPKNGYLRNGNEYHDLMHIVDIFPTVLDAANLNNFYIPGNPDIVNSRSYVEHIVNITERGYKLDAVSHWQAFINQNEVHATKRDHIIYGKSYTKHHSDKISYAIRDSYGYKLIKNYAGESDFKVLPLPTQNKHTYDHVELEQLSKIMEFLETTNFSRDYQEFENEKNKIMDTVNHLVDSGTERYFLYDLINDPSELNNLVQNDEMNMVVNRLKAAMKEGYKDEIQDGHKGTIDVEECGKGKKHWKLISEAVGLHIDSWC